MTSISTSVKHRVRTTGLEHKGQTSFSDPGQNLGFTCIFSSDMQEKSNPFIKRSLFFKCELKLNCSLNVLCHQEGSDVHHAKKSV